MIMVSKGPDELSENDELRCDLLSRSDCITVLLPEIINTNVWLLDR